ncbi:hypothetical protein [Tropicibacter alexandrii]|uniref:hypothetical protein n=1 Tax=Tropicibacter alexandrii TaxID=2267683 RepID=UPI000EF46781|nr:hypothetical protein [Tropicibacter alexandrii]
MQRIATALTLAVLLAGCAGDPLKSVPRVGDVEIAEAAGQADIAAPEEGADRPVAPAPETEAPQGGLMGFLKRKADEGAAAEAAPVAVDAADEAPEIEAPDLAASDVESPAPRRGLFGRILRGEAGRDAGTDPAPQQVAMVAPEAEPDAPLAEARPGSAPKRGLFGRILDGDAGDERPSVSAPVMDPNAPDARQIAFGTRLPFGEVARLCDVPARQLGKRAGGYPERGAQYMLYDSAPGETGPRSYYLTGFKDGCARQFTAALVLFGSPESYEQIHYGPAGKAQPKAQTDAAYELVKSRVCRVGKGKPCGSAMSRLSRDTVFVSVYERFDSNPRWKNILLHDGAVVAVDMK